MSLFVICAVLCWLVAGVLFPILAGVTLARLLINFFGIELPEEELEEEEKEEAKWGFGGDLQHGETFGNSTPEEDLLAEWEETFGNSTPEEDLLAEWEAEFSLPLPNFNFEGAPLAVFEQELENFLAA